MINVHIDVDDAEIYTNIEAQDKRLQQSFIVEALTNALALLKETNTKAVIFVVGKDLEQNIPYQNLLRQFIKEGHAIGNHSYTHAENFHRLSREAQVQDMQRADKVIKRVLDYKPVHFRGPGYSSSHSIQKNLFKLGYLYDCTKIPLLYSSGLGLYFKINKNRNKSFPSILNARDLFFSFTKPIAGIKEQLIHPNKIWGVPIYSTWIFQQKKSSQRISKLIKKTEIPFLFHAIDFLDYSSSTSKIPALSIATEERFRIIREILLELNLKKM
jgi:peptidoglycan/xylan/chitin deacetylase (PgdA/CDA1 family)